MNSKEVPMNRLCALIKFESQLLNYYCFRYKKWITEKWIQEVWFPEICYLDMYLNLMYLAMQMEASIIYLDNFWFCYSWIYFHKAYPIYISTSSQVYSYQSRLKTIWFRLTFYHFLYYLTTYEKLKEAFLAKTDQKIHFQFKVYFTRPFILHMFSEITKRWKTHLYSRRSRNMQLRLQT